MLFTVHSCINKTDCCGAITKMELLFEKQDKCHIADMEPSTCEGPGTRGEQTLCTS